MRRRELLQLASLGATAAFGGCGGGGGGGTTSAPAAGPGSVVARDANGDVLVAAADFVAEPVIGDWFVRVKANPNGFNFHLYIPETYLSEPQKDYPLLIHLHGDDGYQDTRTALTLGPLGGSPLSALKPSGSNQLNAAGRAQLNAHVRDSFVIAPEVPHIDRTGNYAEPLGYWNPNAIKAILGHLQARYRIDKRRIYVTGMSFGGGGTWHVTNRSNNLVAAAVPICGGYDQSLEPATRGIPFWVFHAWNDGTVPWKNSMKVFNDVTSPLTAAATFPAGSQAPTTNYTVNHASGTGLSAWVEGERNISGTSHYTLYASGGHNAWDRAYANDVMWDWLYAQRRAS